MSSIKVLVTGCFGLYGFEICNQLKNNFDLIGTYNNNYLSTDFNTVKFDITDFSTTEKIINDIKPQYIIHSASISNPQKADLIEPKVVYKTNVIATEKLALIADKINARFIFISSDLVYAGYRGSYLKENAKLIPISLYAETKLMAEEKIKNVSNNFTILRNSLMLGVFEKENNNFFNMMYHNLKNKKRVRLFYDQYRTPLSFCEAAKMINQIIQLVENDEKILLNEVVNFGGNERLSRTDLGILLCNLLKLDKNLIDSISVNDLPEIPSVIDVSMNIDKLKSLGVIPNSIEEMIKNEIEKLNKF